VRRDEDDRVFAVRGFKRPAVTLPPIAGTKTCGDSFRAGPPDALRGSRRIGADREDANRAKPA